MTFDFKGVVWELAQITTNARGVHLAYFDSIGRGVLHTKLLRNLRNPVRPIARGKFRPPSPEFASCPLEREAWPRNSASPFTNCRSSRPTSSRNIAFTSRSIRGFGPPPVCSRRSGAKTGTCRSAAMSARTASAANSAAASRKRRAGAGGNFLTPEIAHTARREAAYREIGALIDAERLATNLLSSMPLTFNLLAPWGHTLERASSYLIELLPAFTGAARQLLFEHSPGRGNPKFTADHTAFDALIRYSDSQGRNGFVAFEIKYSESMREPMPELKPRHAELSDASGLFTDPAAAALRTNPLQQLWREHLLAQSMIANGLYDEGYLVVIAPVLNHHVQDAAEAYQTHLREPEDGKVRFVNLTLEDVIEVIRLSDPAHAEALHHRYCDFWLVDGELELNAPTFGQALPRTRQRRKPMNAG